jgi:N-acetylneuraminic acid mutarotase
VLIYDTTADAWTKAAPLQSPRLGGAAAPTADGTGALIFGGSNKFEGSYPSTYVAAIETVGVTA